jgi:hypothetical protein
MLACVYRSCSIRPIKREAHAAASSTLCVAWAHVVAAMADAAGFRGSKTPGVRQTRHAGLVLGCAQR